VNHTVRASVGRGSRADRRYDPAVLAITGRPWSSRRPARATSVGPL
jgi:hypothetical protein